MPNRDPHHGHHSPSRRSSCWSWRRIWGNVGTKVFMKFSHPRRKSAAGHAKFTTDTHDVPGKTTVTGGMQLVRTTDAKRKGGLRSENGPHLGVVTK